MKDYEKEFLKKLNDERKSYRQMIDFCCDSLILNNYIVRELEENGLIFEPFCGSDRTFYNSNGDEITEEEYYILEENGEEPIEQYDDIYQYYIISSNDAERLSDYTNELVMYCDDLDLYILCVKHFGTAWIGVPSNWKTIEND